MLARLARSARASRDTFATSTDINCLKSPSILRLQSRKYNSTAQQALDIALYLPHELFQTIHSLGFSWATTLPIVALLIRACIYIPVFGIPSQKLSQRIAEVVPLKQGWTNATQIGMQRDTSKDKLKNMKQNLRLTHARVKSRHQEVDRDFSTGYLAGLRPLLQFPIFYTFAETIRRMAGIRSSLLGMIVEKMPNTKEGEGNVGTMTEAGAPSDFYLEPSMASEGALWFETLAAADPTHNLSFILSATTFGHVWWSSREATSLRSKVVRRLMLFGAVLIVPITLNLPSAVLLFWLSSTCGAILQRTVLTSMYPIPKPIIKCSRMSSFG